MGLFFLWIKYSYGSAFNNVAFKSRIFEGFSFFSINREKFKIANNDLLLLKSLSTTIPFLLVVNYITFRLIPKELNFKIRKELTWFAVSCVVLLWLFIVLSPDPFAFRLQFTLVNSSTLVKILLGLVFLKGLQDLFPGEDSERAKLETFHFLFPFTFFLIIAFYFFYGDSSPRNINSLHILYVMFAGFLIRRIFASKKAQYIVLAMTFLYQLLWIKVPQVPMDHTHYKLYDEVILSVRNINQKLIDLTKNGKSRIHASKPFAHLLSSQSYGWSKANELDFTSSPSDAEVLIKTNYEDHHLVLNQRIDEYLKSNKTKLIHRENSGKVYFEVHLVL